jgi:tetratricopeptide (TPR) repeat protein
VIREPSVKQGRIKAISEFAVARIRRTLSFFHAIYQTLSWTNLKAAVNASMSNALKLFGVATGILVVSLVVKDLSADLVTIEPISVPKMFSENGYTAEVASRRLRDALGDYATKAKTSMQSPNITPRDELPNIVVPKIDLSLDTIVSAIRSFLNYGSRRAISGELTIRGKLAWLRLRVDGQEVYSSQNGLDPDNFDELFAAAVPAIMERIRPYLVAAVAYDSDPMLAMQKADDIIARLPDNDINVQWSYVLKGIYFERQKDSEQGEKAFRKAISLNRNHHVAYVNLCISLRQQNKLDAAVAECRRAIRIAPHFSDAHANLGFTLDLQNKLDDAVGEYQRAIELNPKDESSRNNLGLILSLRGNLDGAIKEFRRAVAINPESALIHYNLGRALWKTGKTDDAIAEYRQVIKLDLENAMVHNDIGLALDQQGQLEEAIAEYRRAIEVDPNYKSASENLERALRAQSAGNIAAQ